MKYKVVYKCELCGELIQYGDVQEIPYEQLPEICARVVTSQIFKSNPYIQTAPMETVHKCKNGDCGMAYFAGFKKV